MLDERDLEFIEVMRSLEVPRSVAEIIVFLASMSEATSRDIEIGTGLRQPEFSIGMRTLRENNWVVEREVKRMEGKGRPMKFYSLRVPIDEIIKHYEDEKNRESASAMEAIQRLRKMAAT